MIENNNDYHISSSISSEYDDDDVLEELEDLIHLIVILSIMSFLIQTYMSVGIINILKTRIIR